MNKLVVIDFQYLYYKYKFSLLAPGSKMSRLTHNGVDVSFIYYPLHEVVSLTSHGDVDAVICFDCKQNERKEEDENYKANRQSKLDNSDFENINTIYNILEKAGYLVLRGDKQLDENGNEFSGYGKEADDFVATTVTTNMDRYDEIEVYTVDSDLLQLVDSNISVNLFKQRRGYLKVTSQNFESVVFNEKIFKGCYVPNNYTALYKSTVGDASDGIKGITRFGEKAFDKLIGGKNLCPINGTEYDKVEQILREEFSGDKLEQALDSLSRVKLRFVDMDINPVKANNKELREQAFGEYGFKSLV